MRKLIFVNVCLWMAICGGCSAHDSGSSDTNQTDRNETSPRGVHGADSKAPRSPRDEGPASEKDHPDWRKLPLPDLYEVYAKEARDLLDSGSSWVFTNPDVREVLIERVADNKAFFLEKLQEDFFIADLLLRQSSLAAANVDKLRRDETEKWPDHRMQVWVSLLQEDDTGSPGEEHDNGNPENSTEK